MTDGHSRPANTREPATQASVRLVAEVSDCRQDPADFARLEPLVGATVDAVAASAEIRFEATAAAAVTLCDDDAVRRLNLTWRKLDKPTNVLSFPAAPGTRTDGGIAFLGDVTLGWQTLLREAGEQGIPPEHHLQHLVVHGLLHLLGYDHETDAAAEAMEALEVAILRRLGIANPYIDSEPIESPASTRSAKKANG